MAVGYRYSVLGDVFESIVMFVFAARMMFIVFVFGNYE